MTLIKAKREKAPVTFKPRTGRVLYREVIDGITDSYIAEIRITAEGDTRFQIRDLQSRLILEAYPAKMCDMIDMIKRFMNDVAKKKAGVDGHG